jgi:diguanylate cyclase (GGDEF)-like protein
MAERVAEEAIGAGFGAAGVHCRVIAPAMQWLGELWERGEVTVADEHLATAISHNVLARLFPRLLDAPSRSRERVMLAAAEGEHHVLGLRMVADMLEGAGFDVLYLGADVPLDALIGACEKHRPAVVGLAATMPLALPMVLAELVEVSSLEPPPKLMVGGRAFLLSAQVGLTVPVVVDGERAESTVEHLLADGSQGPPLEPLLLERIAGDESAVAATREIGTISDRFSSTALVSADTARDAARRGHAMEKLAFRDPLTGTWNRRAFDDRVAGQSTDDVLLMVDVDHFKAINDTWGHDAGDAALIAVARSILKNVRPSDFVARYGGDEFIVLLPDVGLSEAAEIAERVRTGIVDEVREPSVTVSVGLAHRSGDQRLAGITVDRALYQAKLAGRNRVAGLPSDTPVP